MYLARRDWRMVVAAKLPLGIFIYLVIAAPWFYLVQRATGGRWLPDFIYIHHLQRYTAGVGHRQPLYYYLTTLPADFMPWTIFAVSGLFAFRDYRKVWEDFHIQFFLLWFIMVFVFFSLSDTKRDLYLMPLLPPLALFVGNFIDALAARRWPRDSLCRWIIMIFFALVTLVGLGFPLVAWIMRRDAIAMILAASVVLAVGGACAACFIWRHRPIAALASVSAMMMASVFTASLWIFPYLERFKSPRLFAEEVKKIVPAAAPLYIYADTMNDFNYYTERERIPVLSSPGAVGMLIARGENGFMLIKARDLKRLAQIPREWIAASESDGSTSWHLIEFSRRS